jgi:hypothetical protein
MSLAFFSLAGQRERLLCPPGANVTNLFFYFVTDDAARKVRRFVLGTLFFLRP